MVGAGAAGTDPVGAGDTPVMVTATVTDMADTVTIEVEEATTDLMLWRVIHSTEAGLTPVIHAQTHVREQIAADPISIADPDQRQPGAQVVPEQLQEVVG